MLTVTLYMIIIIYFADIHVVTLECGQNKSQVCQGARVTTSCFTQTAIGLLRWVINGSDWPAAVFNDSSAVNDVITNNSINFTLHSRCIHHNRHLYYSTAVINVMNDIKIGCSDGEDIKHCEVATIGE